MCLSSSQCSQKRSASKNKRATEPARKITIQYDTTSLCVQTTMDKREAAMDAQTLAVPNEDRRMRVRRQQLDGIGVALRRHAQDQLQLGTAGEEHDAADTHATTAVVDTFVDRVMDSVERNTVVEDDHGDDDDDNNNDNSTVPVEPYDFALAEELRAARRAYEELVARVAKLRRAEMGEEKEKEEVEE